MRFVADRGGNGAAFHDRMRPKFAIAVLLVALLLLGVAAFVSKVFKSPLEPSHAQNATNPAAEMVFRKPAAGSVTRPLTLSSFSGTDFVATTAPPTNDPAHAEYVRRRIAELNALAMKSDTVSRDIILSELQNSDRAIRKGALEAAIQFSDRSVIPRLEEVAAQTEDPTEKAEIVEAIEYIKLPSLTEYLAEQRARRASMALTNPSLISTNRRGRPALPPPAPLR